MTNVSSLKPIETKGMDLRQFDGAQVEIESVAVVTVPSKFAGNGESEVLRVQSVPVVRIEGREGDHAIRASELFNLMRGKDGQLGWPNGPNGKLANFLRRIGVIGPEELPGKQGTIRVRRKTGADGTTREFLGFVVG